MSEVNQLKNYNNYTWQRHINSKLKPLQDNTGKDLNLGLAKVKLVTQLNRNEMLKL